MAGQVQNIQPTLSPQTFQMDVVQAENGDSLVVLVFQGHNGQWVTFLDAMSAKSLAAQLEAVANRAQTGLILPPSMKPQGGV